MRTGLAVATCASFLFLTGCNTPAPAPEALSESPNLVADIRTFTDGLCGVLPDKRVVEAILKVAPPEFATAAQFGMAICQAMHPANGKVAPCSALIISAQFGGKATRSAQFSSDSLPPFRDHPIAVLLDLVNPQRPLRHLRRDRRDAGCNKPAREGTPLILAPKHEIYLG
jgi:hypothetical protein